MSDTDVRALLAVFEPTPLVADNDIFYTEVLIRLRELIPCDDITFQLKDVGEQRQRNLFVDGETLRQEGIGARIWGGIHFRTADETADKVGRQVGTGDRRSSV